MRFVRRLEIISNIAGAIGVLLILPLVGAMVFEVLSRYLFGAPTSWAFEISYMLMAAIFAMGIAYALRWRQHVTVDLIYARVGPRAKAIINIVGYIIFLPAIGWLSYELFGYALKAYQSGQVSGISAWNPLVWPLRAVLFVGFAVFALQIAIEIVKSVRAFVMNDDRDL